MSVQVERCADCGNSPKNAFAEEVALAMLSGDAGTLRGVLAADAVFANSGGASVVGCDAILESVSAIPPPQSLRFDMAITHGRAGAVSGSLSHDGVAREFCVAIRFASAKGDRIASMKVYWGT